MPGYCAFISYSHADARFAKALQHDLEKFRIPRQSVARLNLGSDRLGTVFRDVSDLGAASKLNDALTAALTNAGALVVVCSAAAAKSGWVELEILEFKRLHGEHAMILPIIAPKAGADPAEAYFPSALGASPPLAADARKPADGRRVALLKLVAGLLGIGLDELIQRDARRRQARLVAGIAVTSAVALSLAVLAGLAVSAREDAKRRLSQSEDLIGFMLDDLRGQLTPLGQVRVLKSVGDKALSYFESLPDGDLTDEALLRKSRALYQIGDVYFELGEFMAARDSFQLSLDQAMFLAQAEPENTDRLFELSQAEFWVGYAAWYANDFDQAEQHLQAYLKVAWTLHRLEPDNPDWIMETFWAANNLGSLAFSQAQFDVALGYFDEAMARINLLIEQESTLERRFERSTIYSWLGSTHYRMGELQQASEFFQLALAESLDQGNALHREERAYYHGKLAAIERHRGDLDNARFHAQAAVEISAGLVQSDPDSMELLYTRTAQDLELARVNFDGQDPVDYGSLRAAVQRLLATDQPPPKWQALALEVADIGVRLGETGAQEWARQALNSSDSIAGSESTRSVDFRARLDLAISLAERDVLEQNRLREMLSAALQQYSTSHDFDLARPLLRGCQLLRDEACVAQISPVLSAAVSGQSGFISGDAASQQP